MSLNLYLWNDGWNSSTRRTYYIILVRSGFCILSRKTSLVSSCLNNVPYSDEGYRSGGWWDEFVQHSAQEEGGGVMYLIL